MVKFGEELNITVRMGFSRTGIRKSGKMPNAWQIHLNPDAVLGAFIQAQASQNKKGPSSWIFYEILVHYKQEAINYFGQKHYDRLLEKYSKTLVQQIDEKTAKSQQQPQTPPPQPKPQPQANEDDDDTAIFQKIRVRV
jgi:hypothetical protein